MSDKKRRSIAFDQDVIDGIKRAMKLERRKFTEQVNHFLYLKLKEMGYLEEGE